MKPETDRPEGALPPVIRTATVARQPADAFAVFTTEIGAWWPLPTHGLFGARSGGVRFVDNRLVEVATDGTESTWAEVVAWDPPSRLALRWHPGRPGASAGLVTITFDPDEAGTRVQVRHDGWEAFGAEALAQRRNKVGPSAWGYVLDHFADGAEPAVNAPDVNTLVSAYEALFTEAEQGQQLGGFGPPPDGEWGAEQVVAHVALNDLALTAVAQRLIHGDKPVFENQTCQLPSNLAKLIEAEGPDLPGLVTYGRACAAQAVAVARRLSREQRETAVHCRLSHDGEVVLDEPRPWAAIAIDTQAALHLPAHIEQLQKLR